MKCLYWYEEKHIFRIADCGLWIADYKYEKNQLVEGKIVGIDESGKLGIKIGKEVIYFGFKEIEFVK